MLPQSPQRLGPVATNSNSTSNTPILWIDIMTSFRLSVLSIIPLKHKTHGGGKRDTYFYVRANISSAALTSMRFVPRTVNGSHRDRGFFACGSTC